MSDIASLERKKALDIKCGTVVIVHRRDNPAEDVMICLKIDRIGKEYMHYYLVPLEPTAEEVLQLRYVDPEDELIDCAVGVVFELGEGEGDETGRPEIGDIFINESGAYLKIKDDPKTQKLFGYVDIATNLVRVRQERRIKTIHRNWSISLNAPEGTDGNAPSLAELRRAHLETI